MRTPAILVCWLALASFLSGSDTFIPVGTMPGPRISPATVLLPNGNVLVCGGDGVNTSQLNTLSTSALYNPSTGTWSSPGNMSVSRDGHRVTLLPNGKVLASGGAYYNSGYFHRSSAELFDPAFGTWSNTDSMLSQRVSHSATLLSNGTVLVAGGFNGSTTVATAELYFPAGGTWSGTGPMTFARSGHTATLLANGRVLVAGGAASGGRLDSTELYDPVAGTWSRPGDMGTARTAHIAVRLQNGKVLVAGGNNGPPFASAELFDPASGTWSPTGSMTAARSEHSAVLLPSGKVLVAGGTGTGGGTLASAEVYNPATGTWSPVGGMGTPRGYFSATVLRTGRVLVAGGFNGTGASLGSAELFVPHTRPSVRILGPKRIRTKKTSVTFSCRTTGGSVTSVVYKAGTKGGFRKARGAGARWSFRVPLRKIGKTTVAAVASGPGGTSAPARVVVTRIRR